MATALLRNRVLPCSSDRLWSSRCRVWRLGAAAQGGSAFLHSAALAQEFALRLEAAQGKVCQGRICCPIVSHSKLMAWPSVREKHTRPSVKGDRCTVIRPDCSKHTHCTLLHMCTQECVWEEENLCSLNVRVLHPEVHLLWQKVGVLVLPRPTSSWDSKSGLRGHWWLLPVGRRAGAGCLLLLMGQCGGVQGAVQSPAGVRGVAGAHRDSATPTGKELHTLRAGS